jgi:hypothetical protein
MNCIGATHLGFENEMNDVAQLIGPLAATSMKIAGWGARAAQVKQSPYGCLGARRSWQ